MSVATSCDIYNRARCADEVRDALNKWAAHVEALVE